MVFTALGDAVNVAARLQDMTKTLNCTVVISEEVCNNAGITPDGLARTDVAIRGRDQPMTVRTATDPTLLASLLDEQTRLLSAKQMSAHSWCSRHISSCSARLSPRRPRSKCHLSFSR